LIAYSFLSVKPRNLDAGSFGGSLPHPASTRFLSYEELKEATSNFESASILGEGGFGKVYRGILADGTAVAIKKLTSGGPQGDKEFQVEIDMLSRLHHRNLVKLVGYYSSRDSSQHLLCYELVPNGSLEAWLHGNISSLLPLLPIFRSDIVKSSYCTLSSSTRVVYLSHCLCFRASRVELSS
jgi:serine/threonine protein kinase